MELLRLTQAQVANQGGETSVAEVLSSFYSQDSVSSFLLILVTIMIVLPVLFLYHFPTFPTELRTHTVKWVTVKDSQLIKNLTF